jgi:methylated-DNA-[protein]-cysteine S-methyltransferase
MKYQHALDTPIGKLYIAVYMEAISAVSFETPTIDYQAETSPLLIEAAAQLTAYFDKKLTTFDLPLAPKGTPFQQQVWHELLKIGYGTTATYGKISELLHNKGAVRAVGAANGANPIAIIIPCHRIIGSHQKLTGYAGGLWRKQFLLELEGSIISYPTLDLFTNRQ